MTTLDDVAALALPTKGLAVVSTLRADDSIQASLINAAVLTNPFSGQPSVGLVTYGRVKLANLRARPQISVTFTAGWQWATVEGRAQLIGPDDPLEGVDAERLRLLLREIFTAAGGTHDDWPAYDQAMREQGRTAVFVAPTRIYSNPS
jgi:PPOX class probable F420-dependent enzyme